MKLIGNELDKIGDEIYNLAQILEDFESKKILATIKLYLDVVEDKIDDLEV
ncbi:hypothetical protein [Lactococcus sp.]